MHKFLLTLLSIASLFAVGMATPSIASPTSAATNLQLAQRPNCNNPQTQSEMNICASIAYQNADRKLNQVYRQLLPKLSAARKQKLIAAQQAWIKFRDSSCEFERSAYEGGSLAPMIYGFCLANVTEQRTKDLRRYLEDSDL
ncbi:MAG: lysozyme inhibitor LprI family protein [Microcystis sp. M54BS1]|uniref:lysozyme inhibitor LprI family protein n=1 Tax=unclassified Microcystis TaxID=2643300 RepID=UPI00257B6E39|nr:MULTISPECIES: lysozyme inhibitor LprI family protein [unclassified Microcystis]MCA2541099.1 lysozyme inhibitor LprI family protein [Microcystis sp. M54BS1]MCA2595152.1 lysozyme inhibitor LprI family protein [Microcystis sp. M38BS1]MCA2611916.1 lysozyme inhibitor LprI family protein [Microcystis sp. M27BS1]MCA2506058.1 lysozyme inhibitor LprI family protein [Microcystis sp. M62BS1]MCA2509955.1 lysozyme inhibitor LprI family protein [Microcystis sp. M60BS1]